MSDQSSPDLELERQQAALYGTYVANKPIDLGTARAFNVGDPVPVTHVERGVVSEEDVDLVDAPKKDEHATSKAEPAGKAKAAHATTTEPKEA